MILHVTQEDGSVLTLDQQRYLTVRFPDGHAYCKQITEEQATALVIKQPTDRYFFVLNLLEENPQESSPMEPECAACPHKIKAGHTAVRIPTASGFDDLVHVDCMKDYVFKVLGAKLVDVMLEEPF